MLLRLKSNNEIEKEVIASITHSYKCNYKFEEYKEIINFFENKSLQLISYTITEKGYAIKNQNNEYLEMIKEDFINGPDKCNHVISITVILLLKRYLKGKYKLTLCSMDNCSNNGEILKN